MHLYRSLPKPNKPVFVQENFVLSNKHHNTIIRVTNVLQLELPQNIRNDFYCTVRVSRLASCTITNPNNLEILAEEGLFIEGGESFEILSDGNGGFEIVRNRPVQDRNWHKIHSTTQDVIDTGIFMIPGKWRVKNGSEIIYENTTDRDRLRHHENVYNHSYNPEGFLVDVFTNNNKFTGSYALNTDFLFAQNIDFSEYDGNSQLDLTQIKEIQGLENVCNVSNLDLRLSHNKMNDDHYYDILFNFNGREIDVNEADNRGVNYFDLKDKNNLKNFIAQNLTGVGFEFHLSNYQNLEKIDIYQNDKEQLMQVISITDCPKLNFVKMRSYQYNHANAVDKNIDQILIDRDNSGVLNGEWWTSEDYIRTSASDSAVANLQAKGWTLTFTRDK